jgi:hypothetical protein
MSATDFPDRAPAGYVWLIAEVVTGDKFFHSYLRTRPELGRFALHSEARKSIKERRGAHTMTLVPVLAENMPIVVEDDGAGSAS